MDDKDRKLEEITNRPHAAQLTELAAAAAASDSNLLEQAMRHAGELRGLTEGASASEIDVLEEITRGGLPSNIRAEIATCAVQYVRAGKAYPERCQLTEGHPPRSSTANHYHGNIGWWA